MAQMNTDKKPAGQFTVGAAYDLHLGASEHGRYPSAVIDRRYNIDEIYHREFGGASAAIRAICG